jgi:hypothetical protein
MTSGKQRPQVADDDAPVARPTPLVVEPAKQAHRPRSKSAIAAPRLLDQSTTAKAAPTSRGNKKVPAPAKSAEVTKPALPKIKIIVRSSQLPEREATFGPPTSFGMRETTSPDAVVAPAKASAKPAQVSRPVKDDSISLRFLDVSSSTTASPKSSRDSVESVSRQVARLALRATEETPTVAPTQGVRVAESTDEDTKIRFR